MFSMLYSNVKYYRYSISGTRYNKWRLEVKYTDNRGEVVDGRKRAAGVEFERRTVSSTRTKNFRSKMSTMEREWQRNGVAVGDKLLRAWCE